MTDEVEKQEGQKTVVAFIAGLLIGGLLVWVFSAPPENTTEENGNGSVTTEETDDTEDSTVTGDVSDDTGSESQSEDTTTSAEQPETVGDGEISVSSQGAGSVVVLDSVTYPTNNGWVVVRDYVDGTPGRILGAARYSQEVGLTPTSVSLLRATESGNTYRVTFYSENGDRVFDLDDDVEIEGFSATFTAE